MLNCNKSPGGNYSFRNLLEPRQKLKHNSEKNLWNLSSEGWYSGDLHLHVDRFEKEDNQLLAQILKAEDLRYDV